MGVDAIVMYKYVVASWAICFEVLILKHPTIACLASLANKKPKFLPVCCQTFSDKNFNLNLIGASKVSNQRRVAQWLFGWDVANVLCIQ